MDIKTSLQKQAPSLRAPAARFAQDDKRARSGELRKKDK